jgi:hypothetical protein
MKRSIVILLIVISLVTGAAIGGGLVIYTTTWEYDDGLHGQVACWGERGHVIMEFSTETQPSCYHSMPSNVAAAVGDQVQRAARDSRRKP